ncbi:MAG: DNA gyrase inhibitor YacG [Planctomycetota bacterium]
MNHICPVCKKSVKGSPEQRPEQTSFFPFCSSRCRLIDLGAWLDASYKIVSESTAQQSIESPAPDQEPPHEEPR